MKKIDRYLQAALELKASDLHFVSGDPVRARVHGGLTAIMDERLTIEVVQEAMTEIMDGTTQRTLRITTPLTSPTKSQMYPASA